MMKQIIFVALLLSPCVFGATLKKSPIPKEIVKANPGIKEIVTNCQNGDHGTYGYISSPNYAMCYPNNALCTWIITSHPGSRIRLSFNDFSLEYSSSCLYDYLEVRDGGSPGSNLIGKYCGNTLPSPINSSGDQLHITFQTDGSVTKRGFHAFYSALSQSMKNETSGGFDWLESTTHGDEENTHGWTETSDGWEETTHGWSETTYRWSETTDDSSCNDDRSTEPPIWTTTIHTIPTTRTTTFRPTPSPSTTKNPIVAPGIVINNNNNMFVNFFDFAKFQDWFASLKGTNGSFNGAAPPSIQVNPAQ